MLETSPQPRPALQYVVLCIVTLVTIAAIAIPAYCCYITNNPLFLIGDIVAALGFGYVWSRIVTYAFPKRKEDYEIEALKIRTPVEQPNKITRIPTFKADKAIADDAISSVKPPLCQQDVSIQQRDQQKGPGS